MKPSKYFPLPLLIRQLLLLLCIGMMVTSCGNDDDDGGHGGGQSTADVNFSISGFIQGTRSGSGIVTLTEQDDNYRLTFSFTDADATDTTDQGTFNLELYQGPQAEPLTFPEPGSYSIGGVQQDEEDFTVIYTDTPLGLTFLGQANGTLTITESNAEFIRGTFEFAVSTLSNPDNAIEVSNGVFRAAVIE